MTKATAIYVRVSHRDQSHASQFPDLERWVEANGGPVARKIGVTPGAVSQFRLRFKDLYDTFMAG